MVLLVMHLCLFLGWLDWLEDRFENNERSGNGGGRARNQKRRQVYVYTNNIWTTTPLVRYTRWLPGECMTLPSVIVERQLCWLPRGRVQNN